MQNFRAVLYVHRLNVVDNSPLCSFLARINELRSMHSSDVGHQVDKIRMQEQDWATREQEYRKRIQQLEAKVGGRWGYTIPALAFQQAGIHASHIDTCTPMHHHIYMHVHTHTHTHMHACMHSNCLPPHLCP